MFSLGEKIALGITAVEYILLIGGIKYINNVYNDTYLNRYGMTASEYVKTVIESKDTNNYKKRIKREIES